MRASFSFPNSCRKRFPTMGWRNFSPSLRNWTPGETAAGSKSSLFSFGFSPSCQMLRGVRSNLFSLVDPRTRLSVCQVSHSTACPRPPAPLGPALLHWQQASLAEPPPSCSRNPRLPVHLQLRYSGACRLFKRKDLPINVSI